MSRPGGAAWIAVLALPVVAVGARLVLDARDEGRRARPERERAGPTTGATIWNASGDVEGIGRVVVRVAPLHADPARQAFESAALRARVAGLVGDPFLVRIEVHGDATSRERLDANTVRVDDDEGVALRVPALPLASSGDPLSTLLHAPTPIGAGERASFVVFGREPRAGARFVRADGGSLPLASEVGAPGAGDLPIASIDRKAHVPTEGGQ